MRRLSVMLCCVLGLMMSVSWGQHAVFKESHGFLRGEKKMNVYLFTEAKHRLVVRDEGDMRRPRYGSLDKAMRQSPCVAGVNGGYFSADPAGSPLGMVVQDGRVVHELQTGSFAVGGIVYDTGKSISIIRSKAFAAMKQKPRVMAALQGGPFLLENGKIPAGLNREKSTYRTFMATDGKGRWCIGFTSMLTLQDLAEWLQQPDAMGDFKVRTALNLDGGSSSAFWCHDTGISFPSFKAVRNYLGVAPR